MSNVMVKEYYGTSTPEAMDVDRGVQRLAMLVLFAALKDKYGKAHKFQFSEGESPHAGNREWRALRNTDDERWRDFVVSPEEVEDFEGDAAFDYWVALMGGDIRLWHRIFKDFNVDGDARRMLETASQRLREE